MRQRRRLRQWRRGGSSSTAGKVAGHLAWWRRDALPAGRQGVRVERLPIAFYHVSPTRSNGGLLTSDAAKFRELTGYEPAKLSRCDLHPLLDLVVPEDRGCLEEELQLAIRQRRAFDALYRIRHGAGRIRYIMDLGTVLIDNQTGSRSIDGAIIGVSHRTAFPNEPAYDLSARLLVAAEKERGRIARELHDGIGQGLTSIAIRLGQATALLQDSGAIKTGFRTVLEAEVESARAMARESLEEVRRICEGLRPAVLEDLGIRAALDWLKRRFQQNKPDIECHADIDLLESDVPDGLKIEVFRIVQEALNNVAKHANAKHVWLVVRRKDGDIVVAIKDDGCGIDTARRERGRGGSGLVNLRQRVALAGGRISIEVNGGTLLNVSLPSQPKRAKARKRLAESIWVAVGMELYFRLRAEEGGLYVLPGVL